MTKLELKDNLEDFEKHFAEVMEGTSLNEVAFQVWMLVNSSYVKGISDGMKRFNDDFNSINSDLETLTPQNEDSAAVSNLKNIMLRRRLERDSEY